MSEVFSVEPLKVGILLFNEVEVLDFAGPFEVFSATDAKENEPKPFEVMTITQDGDRIRTTGGLTVLPGYSFQTCPKLDILIIPGGIGARTVEAFNHVLLDWVRQKAQETTCLATVCTGAFILAELGMLDGKKATTHWASIDRLRQTYPHITVLENVKFVDEGHILTAAGISAGLELSFHLVEKILGTDAARRTARRMEYDIEL